MSAPKVDPLADLHALLAYVNGFEWSRQWAGRPHAEMDAAEQAIAAVAELIAADTEYDTAVTAFSDLNRHIAERGWLEIEFDALRKAGDRLATAKIRRQRALDRVGGAA